MASDDVSPNLGVSRRDVIKRGAIAGGALVWATPVVQSFGGVAFGQTADGTPRCRPSAAVNDIASSSFAGSSNVTYNVQLAGGCEPAADCPPTVRITWACLNTENIVCDTASAEDQLFMQAQIGTCGQQAEVNVRVILEIECPDGTTKTACRTEFWRYVNCANGPGTDVSGDFCP